MAPLIECEPDPEMGGYRVTGPDFSPDVAEARVFPTPDRRVEAQVRFHGETEFRLIAERLGTEDATMRALAFTAFRAERVRDGWPGAEPH